MEAALKMKAKPAPKHQPGQIITLQKINSSLATIPTVDEAKTIRDKTEALRIYYQQQANCRDIERQATVVRLRAERRIGELLMATVKRGNPKVTRPDHCLNSLGISKKQSSTWQQVAKVPAERFEAYLNGRGQLSTVGAIKLVRQPAAESVEVLAERTINRLRAQIADRLGCTPDSKRVDLVLAAAVNRMKLAV